MKIYDCFIFNNELDLLELRLMELGEYVDWFVLCEMGHNFMQQPKALNFRDNQARFERWLPRIRHVVPSHYPIEPHPAMEVYQRRCLARGFNDAKVDDVIVLGDVDEIPSREVLRSTRGTPPQHPFTCVQRLYYYYVNCQQLYPWRGTVIAPRGCLGEDPDCQKLRDSRHVFPRLWKAGWHFSWLGPEQAIQEKLDSIDVEADARIYETKGIRKPSSSDRAFIRHCLETGADLFGRDDPYAAKTFVPLDPGTRQPYATLEWLGKYPQYFKETAMEQVSLDQMHNPGGPGTAA